MPTPWWLCVPAPETVCPTRRDEPVVFSDYDVGFKFPTQSSRVPSASGEDCCPPAVGTPAEPTPLPGFLPAPVSFPLPVVMPPPPGPVCFMVDLTKAKLYADTGDFADNFLTTGFSTTPTLVDMPGIQEVSTIVAYDPYINPGLVPFSVSMEFPQHYLYVVDLFFTSTQGATFAPGIPDAEWIPDSTHFIENILAPKEFQATTINNVNSYMLDGGQTPSMGEVMSQHAYWDASPTDDILGGSFMLKTHVLINTSTDRVFLCRYYVNGELVRIQSHSRNINQTQPMLPLGESLALRWNTSADSIPPVVPFDPPTYSPTQLANVQFCSLVDDADAVILEHTIASIATGEILDFPVTIDETDKVVFVILSGINGDADLLGGPVTDPPTLAFDTPYYSGNGGSRETMMIRDKFTNAPVNGPYTIHVYGYAASTNLTLKIIKVKG